MVTALKLKSRANLTVMVHNQCKLNSQLPAKVLFHRTQQLRCPSKSAAFGDTGIIICVFVVGISAVYN